MCVAYTINGKVVCGLDEWGNRRNAGANGEGMHAWMKSGGEARRRLESGWINGKLRQW